MINSDMVMEVLSHLPAKQVYKFRPVSKSFDAVSTASGLFLPLLQSANVNTDHGVFFKPYGGYPELFFLDGGSSGVPTESLRFLRDKKAERLLGSFNGLTLFESNANDGLGRGRGFDDLHSSYYGMRSGGDVMDSGGGDDHLRLCIYNPATMEWSNIPHGPASAALKSTGVAVAFEQGDANYEILYMASTLDWEPCMDCWIYTSKQGTWRKTKALLVGPRNLKFESPLFIDRKVYILSDCDVYLRSDPYIVAIDVDNERSELLPLPTGARAISDSDDIEIARWGSPSMCLIRWCKEEAVFRLWRLEDKNKWIWDKEWYEISMESMGLKEEEGANMTGFTMINEENLVFLIWNVVHVFGLKDRRLKTFKGEQEAFFGPSLFLYANTLRSSNPMAA